MRICLQPGDDPPAWIENGSLATLTVSTAYKSLTQLLVVNWTRKAIWLSRNNQCFRRTPFNATLLWETVVRKVAEQIESRTNKLLNDDSILSHECGRISQACWWLDSKGYGSGGKRSATSFQNLEYYACF
eukprot:Gb_15012 [translate_table: standard]